jgi:hypothetical protein
MFLVSLGKIFSARNGSDARLHVTSLEWLDRNARLLTTEDMPPSNSHGQRKVVYKTKVLQTEVRNKRAELRNSRSLQCIAHGCDKFFIVEGLHEKCDRPDGHSRGPRRQIFTRSDDDHFSTR